MVSPILENIVIIINYIWSILLIFSFISELEVVVMRTISVSYIETLKHRNIET